MYIGVHVVWIKFYNHCLQMLLHNPKCTRNKLQEKFLNNSHHNVDNRKKNQRKSEWISDEAVVVVAFIHFHNWTWRSISQRERNYATMHVSLVSHMAVAREGSLHMISRTYRQEECVKHKRPNLVFIFLDKTNTYVLQWTPIVQHLEAKENKTNKLLMRRRAAVSKRTAMKVMKTKGNWRQEKYDNNSNNNNNNNKNNGNNEMKSK